MSTRAAGFEDAIRFALEGSMHHHVFADGAMKARLTFQRPLSYEFLGSEAQYNTTSLDKCSLYDIISELAIISICPASSSSVASVVTPNIICVISHFSGTARRPYNGYNAPTARLKKRSRLARIWFWVFEDSIRFILAPSLQVFRLTRRCDDASRSARIRVCKFLTLRSGRSAASVPNIYALVVRGISSTIL